MSDERKERRATCCPKSSRTCPNPMTQRSAPDVSALSAPIEESPSREPPARVKPSANRYENQHIGVQKAEKSVPRLCVHRVKNRRILLFSPVSTNRLRGSCVSKRLASRGHRSSPHDSVRFPRERTLHAGSTVPPFYACRLRNALRVVPSQSPRGEREKKEKREDAERDRDGGSAVDHHDEAETARPAVHALHAALCERLELLIGVEEGEKDPEKAITE